MRTASVSALAFVVAIAAVVWHLTGPLWTLDQMRRAAEARDAAALASFVDFPALRDSLRSEVAAAMLAEAAAEDSEFGPLGAALGMAVLDPMIDGLVSPAGIALMFAGDDAPAATAPVRLDPEDVTIEREGFSSFRVTAADDPAAGALVFRRHGHRWRLAAVDLPDGGRLAAR
jgi:hypothetical protein